MYVHVCVRQGVHICVTVSMCRQGVGVSCVLVCRRPWMLSRLQLGTAMVHVQCRKQQEQATYKLNGHTLKTSSLKMYPWCMLSIAIINHGRSPSFVIVWMLLAECSESISHNHTAHIKKCPDSIVGKRQRPQVF